jgi:hypothetical protein
VVLHQTGDTERYGRVVYQGVLAESWFKIYWDDDTTTEHDGRMLRNLLKVDEANAPPNLIPHPGPHNVMVIQEAKDLRPFFTINKPQDLLRTLNAFMPENHSLESAEYMFRCCQRKHRMREQISDSPKVLDSLFAALDFRAVKTVLDPWAENPAVFSRFATLPNKFVANCQVMPKVRMPKNIECLNLHPLEDHLYDFVAKTVDLDACVSIPPEPLIDLALITALYHTNAVVCMLVPTTYVAQAPWQRFQFLMQCEAQDRILTVTAKSDPSRCWLCIFHSPDVMRCMIRNNVDPALRWVVVNA